MIRKLMTGGLALGLAASLHAQDADPNRASVKPTAVIPFLAKAPTIDGVIAEGEWETLHVARFVGQGGDLLQQRPGEFWVGCDRKKLYVAVSDPAKPVIMVFDVPAKGRLGEGRVFFDASELARTKKGLPDGLKVDRNGTLFATGPGGVLVLSPEGQHLGTIDPGDVVSNCAWGGDGSVLYMTANHCLCRIKTLTRGRP